MEKSKKVSTKGSKNALDDDRFKHLTSESKFVYTLPKKEEKTILDKRFVKALKAERFQNKAKVDKYGRIVKKKSAIAVEMEELYMEEEEEEESGDEDVEESCDNEESEAEDEEENGEDENEEEEEEDDKELIKIDLARGDVDILSSSDDDTDEDDWDLENKKTIAKWGEIDKDARRVEWSSRRVAICNLDWDNLCSEDLFILCKSFLPPGGCVRSLTVYLSDFGKERLEEEQLNGPSIAKEKNGDENNEDDENQKSIDIEAVRQYELDRLKYYYALLECDNADSATAIYEACDGIEFENSGLKIDMRFVPDEMEFEESRVKERVTGEEVNEEKYKPKAFISKAASSTNAEIAWDENNPDRARKFQCAFEEGNDLDEIEKEYIADSDSEEEETEHRDSRINTLLEAAGVLKENTDLQVDWEEGDVARDSTTGGDGVDRDDDKDIDDEQIIEKNKKNETNKKGTWDEYLERRKEKRRERKDIAKTKKAEEKEAREQEQGETQKKKKKKAKAPTDLEAERVASDDRFKALFTDSAFAIEQTATNFKGSKLINKQVEAKKVRKAQIEESSKEVDLVTKLKEKAAKMHEKRKRKL